MRRSSVSAPATMDEAASVLPMSESIRDAPMAVSVNCATPEVAKRRIGAADGSEDSAWDRRIALPAGGATGCIETDSSFDARMNTSSSESAVS